MMLSNAVVAEEVMVRHRRPDAGSPARCICIASPTGLPITAQPSSSVRSFRTYGRETSSRAVRSIHPTPQYPWTTLWPNWTPWSCRASCIGVIPAFLGYFGSTSNGAALIGEMVAAALNVSAMTWQTSPAATELETVVLGWIRRMIALPDAFTGIVYDTASTAVLHALAAAREQLRRRGAQARHRRAHRGARSIASMPRIKRTARSRKR